MKCVSLVGVEANMSYVGLWAVLELRTTVLHLCANLRYLNLTRVFTIHATFQSCQW